MAKNVTIIYTGISNVDSVANAARKTAGVEPLSIYPLFQPEGAYVDATAYAGTVYDTNVEGWGELGGLEPMGSATVKFAEYARAYRAYEEATAAGTSNTGITFQIDTYEDELYWIQIGRNMVDQGYSTTLTDVEENDEG